MTLRTLEDQLTELTSLLTKEVICYNTLSLASIAVKSMQPPIRNDYCSYIKFIDWCSKNLSVQYTKILLSGINPSHIWLTVCTSELNEMISKYQDACETSGDDMYVLKLLAELRMKLLDEYSQSEDVAGLLITDRFLEKCELARLEKIVEGVECDNWKIVSVGMWITQLLYLYCIRPKQNLILINMFEELKVEDRPEMVKELLNEMLVMVVEVYLEVFNSVNHQECEALAAILHSKYRVVYFRIFAIASEFLLKTLPMVNEKMGNERFLCFYAGSFTGKLWVLKEDQKITAEDCILFAEYIPDDFEFTLNVKAVLVSHIDSLFNPSLLQMRQQGIPICLCVDPHKVEDTYTLTLSEDSFTLTC